MTLFDFYKKFDTQKKCFDYLQSIRWPDGIKCPHCGHGRHYVVNNISRVKVLNKNKETSALEYKCANNKCYKKFSITTKTIFHSSNVPLWQFFYMMFSSVSNKKNVSSCQQSINLGITQKTCWHIMSRIRMLCFQEEKLKLIGEVEVDETYLAAAKWQRHEKYVSGRKIPVLGLIERGGGKIIVKVIPNKNKKTVQDIILRHVETGSRLITDSAACYINMDSYYYHDTINHREGIYCVGDVHTNNIENHWAHFKKALVGTHHGVSILHLQRYCDEFAYRCNTKDMTPFEKFNDLLSRGCRIKPVNNTKVGFGEVKKKKKFYTYQDFDAIPTLEFIDLS